MAEDNIKEFTVNWMIIGLLTFCLMSFAITFIFNNNPGGLGDGASNKFNQTMANLSSNLGSTEVESDRILNITANTNPEAGDLGSRDSVASAYKTKETATGFFDSIKIFIAWVFVGDIGKMLISLISGIVGFTSIYFIVKWIRNGI